MTEPKNMQEMLEYLTSQQDTITSLRIDARHFESVHAENGDPPFNNLLVRIKALKKIKTLHLSGVHNLSQITQFLILSQKIQSLISLVIHLEIDHFTISDSKIINEFCSALESFAKKLIVHWGRLFSESRSFIEAPLYPNYKANLLNLLTAASRVKNFIGNYDQHVDFNYVSEEEIDALVNFTKTNKYKELNFNGIFFSLDDKRVLKLVNAIKENHSIESLSLKRTTRQKVNSSERYLYPEPKYNDQFHKALIAELIHHPSIVHLDLGDYDTVNASECLLEGIAKLIQEGPLTSLNLTCHDLVLSWNLIGPVIENNRKLTLLDLSHTGDWETIKNILTDNKYNEKVYEVDSEFEFNEDDLEDYFDHWNHFVSAIQYNKSIKTLSLRGLNITPELEKRQSLALALNKNTCIQHVDLGCFFNYPILATGFFNSFTIPDHWKTLKIGSSEDYFNERDNPEIVITAFKAITQSLSKNKSLITLEFYFPPLLDLEIFDLKLLYEFFTVLIHHPTLVNIDLSRSKSVLPDTPEMRTLLEELARKPLLRLDFNSEMSDDFDQTIFDRIKSNGLVQQEVAAKALYNTDIFGKKNRLPESLASQVLTFVYHITFNSEFWNTNFNKLKRLENDMPQHIVHKQRTEKKS